MQRLSARVPFFIPLLIPLAFPAWYILLWTGAAQADGVPSLPPSAPGMPVVSSAPAVSADVPPPSLARKRYGEGRELFQAKQYGEAIPKLSQAAESAAAENLPADEQAVIFYLLGLSHSRAGRNAEAIVSYQRSLAFNPKDAEAHLDLADLLLRAGRNSDARREAEEAQRLGLADSADRTAACTLVANALFNEARALYQARKYEEAAKRLKEAAQKAREAQLSPEEQSLRFYLLGLILSRLFRDQEAIAAFRQALALNSRDAECRLELAQALLRTNEYAAARREGELALAAGLDDQEDQKDARVLIQEAKTEYLRERLSFYGSASFGGDTNVLQGNRQETIAGRPIGSSQRYTTMRGTETSPRRELALALSNPATYTQLITDQYVQPVAEKAEWDLPITLQIDLNGRLVGGRAVELWMGYRFYQYILSSVRFDHDIYNIQEHTLPLSLTWNPAKWLSFRPRFEGFVNFTGLKSFTPYQGGFLAVLESTFAESRFFYTRLLYQHQLRRSFDRTDDAFLDADRDDLRITQELRWNSNWLRLRGQLSYRFRSERAAGAVEIDVPVPVPSDSFTVFIPNNQRGFDKSPYNEIGYYHYVAPLSYNGHEIATRWRFYVPWGLVLGTGIGIENRSYIGSYKANYKGSSAKLCLPSADPRICPSGSGGVNVDALEVSNLPAETRHDNLVNFDLSVLKNLPLGFSLELAYLLMKNFSSIANGLDNRNYIKHTVTLTAGYSF